MNNLSVSGTLNKQSIQENQEIYETQETVETEGTQTNYITEQSKKIKIMTHHKYFNTSLTEVLNILVNKSNTVDTSLLSVKITKAHKRLRDTCEKLKGGFSLNNENYDQSKIIKKIYKVITQYISKFYPEPSTELFRLKNESGEIITIIPGVDINLIIPLMSESEIDNLWNYMYVMYISSVSIISIVNEHKKGKVYEIMPDMRERVVKSGILNGGGESNPFFGLFSNNHQEYDINDMFKNVDNIDDPASDIMSSLFKMSGIEKLIDTDSLGDQLKNIKQEDITEATKSITKMLGAEDDEDITEVCNSMVEDVVKNLTNNSDKGIEGMRETIKNMSSKISSNVDNKKLSKVLGKLSTFMENGEENLKNLKDENGNMIGESIFESLKGPLEMLQNMKKGNNGMPDMASMQSLFAQFSKMSNAKK
jgi:hypothetical protein